MLRLSTFQWLDSAYFGISSVADIITAIVLVKTLRSSRTGFKKYVIGNGAAYMYPWLMAVPRTDTMLERLILYTINTGLLTG